MIRYRSNQDDSMRFLITHNARLNDALINSTRDILIGNARLNDALIQITLQERFW